MDLTELSLPLEKLETVRTESRPIIIDEDVITW